MLTIAYYFLQVMLCSGMLMGYYWLVLRNKRFHQYNRFFLLAAALLSWIVPLIKITWTAPALQSEAPPVMNILAVVANNNTQIETQLTQKTFVWNWALAASILYIAISAILLLAMIHAFVKLYRLLKHHSCKNVGDVFLILTHAKGTPFSFFRYIFWNEEIDIRSQAGQQILRHELTHVQQKHSFDKLFIQVMLIGGWFNPFFWLLKKEMEMIHEFIADKKAVNNGDTAALAQMLLTAAYPQQRFALTHPFFFSPIKRRLLMLANNKTPRFSYIRRLVVLPLLAIVVVLFAFRSKAQRNGEISIASVVENYKEDIRDVFVKEEEQPDGFILVNGKKIDAETISMKELVSTSYMIGLLDEKRISSDRNSIAFEPIRNMQVADPVFILNGQRASKEEIYNIDPATIESIHVYKNAQAIELFGADAANGVIAINLKPGTGNAVNAASVKENGNFSLPLQSGVAKDTYNNVARNRKVYVNVILYQGEEKNRIYEEVSETKSDENGNFSVKIGGGTEDASSKDLSQVDLSRGPFYVNLKVAIAPSIPAAWWQPSQNYADLGFSQVLVKDNRKENDPDVLKDVVVSGYKSANTGTQTASKNTFLLTDTTGNVSWRTPQVSGQKDKGTDEVTVVGYATPISRQTAAQPARFPGGDIAWEKYLARNLDKDIPKKNNATPGRYTVVVSFLVDKEGGISDVHAENDPGFGTKAEAERMILKGPKWVPGTNERGKAVLFRQRQPISFVYEDEKPTITVTGVKIKAPNTSSDSRGMISAVSVPGISGTITGGTFSGTSGASTVTPPAFPGGLPAWSKYVERNVNLEEMVAKGAPPGTYTVIVSFFVAEDGTVSDIRADNDPGFGSKQQGIRLISKGPKWVPAMANGKPTTARHRAAIVFTLGGGQP